MALTNLIDSTYFINELFVPNLERAGTSEKLSNLITKYQRKILIDALGMDLYLALNTNYNSSVQDKWYELVHGLEYDIDYGEGDYTMKWNGLVNTEKESLLAYFTFYYLLLNHQTSFFNTGIGNAEANNIKSSTAKYKLVQAWNEGIELYGLGHDSSSDINKWLVFGYKSAGEMYYDRGLNNTEVDPITKPTLYNFIIHKNTEDSTTYPNFNFTRIERSNIIGI